MFKPENVQNNAPYLLKSTGISLIDKHLVILKENHLQGSLFFISQRLGLIKIDNLPGIIDNAYFQRFWLQHFSRSSKIKDAFPGLEKTIVPAVPFKIIPAAWGTLVKWLEASHYTYGNHQWLEEHLTRSETSDQGFVLDLYIPILNDQKALPRLFIAGGVLINCFEASPGRFLFCLPWFALDLCASLIGSSMRCVVRPSHVPSHDIV